MTHHGGKKKVREGWEHVIKQATVTALDFDQDKCILGWHTCAARLGRVAEQVETITWPGLDMLVSGQAQATWTRAWSALWAWGCMDWMGEGDGECNRDSCRGGMALRLAPWTVAVVG